MSRWRSAARKVLALSFLACWGAGVLWLMRGGSPTEAFMWAIAAMSIGIVMASV